MTDARWRLLWDVFHDALEVSPGGRAAFVARACGGDPDLIREVGDLLAAHDSDAGFLESLPVLDGGPEPDSMPEGGRIGPYQLRRVLGQGGMGTVYQADQEGDIARRVALKLVRPGMESREILARFAMERQALALMNHPNIATAYDVGLSADGRPYFAMEFVEGEPITAFCDRRRLSLADRLALFRQICDAVQHAHQKGVIHRDLKPSNVLAGEQEGRTVLKVIDFGVAKLVDRRRAGAPVETAAGLFMGTFEYMSPEQAGVAATDVDTRADVYSLGVMLYELLTGVLPVDAERLRSVSLGEMERLLFDEPLVRPGERVRLQGAAAGRAAEARGLAPPALVRALAGDLDAIVAKAMSRDRALRYATASELAADVSRHLAGEPVLAAAPTTVYRLRKFAARHRGGVAAAAVMLVVSIGFVISLAISNARTSRALSAASDERARASQVSAFLVDLFRVSNPTTAQANAVTARELLDKGVAAIGERLNDQPVVRAQLMVTMGEVYTNLGLPDPALELMQQALALQRQTYAADHVEIATTLSWIGRILREKGDYKPALASHQESLAMRRRLLGGRHLDVSESLNNIGVLLRIQGDLDGAERALRESLDIKTAQAGADEIATTVTMQNLAGVALAKGDVQGAIAWRRRILDLRLARLGDQHIEVARARNDLAAALRQASDEAGAEPLLRSALATFRSVLGEDHPDVVTAMSNLSATLQSMGGSTKPSRWPARRSPAAAPGWAIGTPKPGWR